jgi:hypothetical protein
MRRLPGPADDRLGDEGDFRGSLRFVSGLAENTHSIFCDSSSELETANGCPVLRGAGTTSREAQVRRRMIRERRNARSPERAKESRAFYLTKTFMDAGYPLSAGINRHVVGGVSPLQERK